ncbi:MAG: hypothetical protein ABFQ53_03540, partial [Patescibacteria group bacterium]
AEAENLKQVQLDYVQAENFLNKLFEFQRSVEFIDEDTEWMNVLLSDDDDEKVRLFSYLEELAKETGNESIHLSVKGVDPKKPPPKAATPKEGVVPVMDTSINLQMVLVGNYNDLIYFLKKVENLPYFSDVLSLSIAKTSDPRKGIPEKAGEARNDLLKTSMNVVFYLNSKDDK